VRTCSPPVGNEYNPDYRSMFTSSTSTGDAWAFQSRKSRIFRLKVSPVCGIVGLSLRVRGRHIHIPPYVNVECR